MQTGPLAADQSSTTNNVMNKSITNHDVLREAVHIDDQPLYRGPLGCCLIQVSDELYLLNDCVSIMITRIALLITPIPAHLVIERFEERTESSLNSIIDAKI